MKTKLLLVLMLAAMAFTTSAIAFPYGTVGSSMCDYCLNVVVPGNNDDHTYLDLNEVGSFRAVASPGTGEYASIDLGWCNPSYNGRTIQVGNRGVGTFTVYADYWDMFDVLDTIEGSPTFDVPADRKFYELICNCRDDEVCNFTTSGGGVWTWSES